MRFVILTLLVIGILYLIIHSLVAINTAQRKAAESKIQATLEHATSHVIPSDFILTESKYYPVLSIDTNSTLIRTYTVNKPRDVVIDELLRSLKAHGYSPDEIDIPKEFVRYDTYNQYPFFTIMIPYEEPPIHVFVTVTP
jgi:hypothetical protein